MTKKKTTKVKAKALVKKETGLMTAGQQSAEVLIAQAIDKGISVETMKELLAMRKELKAEWAKEQFDNAMAEFQTDCPIIKKTKGVKTKTGQEAYKYAPIESIVEQVKPFLKEYGFSYSIKQIFSNETKMVKITCIVKHRDGHSEEYEMEVPLGTKTQIMSDTQVVAAASTFAKRYAFCNAFGILTGDDDNDAKPPQNQPSKDVSYNKTYQTPKQGVKTAPESPQQATVADKRTIAEQCKKIAKLTGAKEPKLAGQFKGLVYAYAQVELEEKDFKIIIPRLKKTIEELEKKDTKEVEELAKAIDGEVIDDGEESTASKGMKAGMAKAKKGDK